MWQSIKIALIFVVFILVVFAGMESSEQGISMLSETQMVAQSESETLLNKESDPMIEAADFCAQFLQKVARTLLRGVEALFV